MKRTIGIVITLTIITLIAQAGLIKRASRNSDIDFSSLRTVTGTVQTVHMEQGEGAPGFTVETVEEGLLDVHLGPYWFLVLNEFAVGEGDEIVANVADCVQSEDASDVTAFYVNDLTSQTEITLRDDRGFVLWSGGRGGHSERAEDGEEGGGQNQQQHQRRYGNSGYCSELDLDTLIVVEGVVTERSLGLGLHSNSITIAVGEEAYVVNLGPIWHYREFDFTVEVEDALLVEMAQCTGEVWGAFSITNPQTGDVIVLRDENGLPLWWE